MKSKRSSRPTHRVAKGSAFGSSSTRRRAGTLGAIPVHGGMGMDTMGKLMQKAAMGYQQAADLKGPSFP